MKWKVNFVYLKELRYDGLNTEPPPSAPQFHARPKFPGGIFISDVGLKWDVMSEQNVNPGNPEMIRGVV